MAEGLQGPTQVAVAPDGELWVADLGGDEDAGTGRVVRLGDDGTPTVVLDGLDKPTGLVVTATEIWVMQRRSLSFVVRGPDGGASDVSQVVAEDLAFNGRSEGTLTATDDRILFTETGIGSGGEAGRPSGRLLAANRVDPRTPPSVLATGLKNAYAHLELEPDVLLVTEIGDGQYDGNPPPDELNLVRLAAPGAAPDAGWPRCVGAGVPVVEFGGTEAACASTVQPVAVFAPRATPTGVAVFDGAWLVSLWVEGRIVEVPVGGGAPTTWYEHDGPGIQDLLVDGDSLLVTDHLGGRLLRFTPA